MIAVMNKLFWGMATFFIVGSGLYFTCRLRLVQFRFGEMFRNLFGRSKKEEGGITPFQSLMMVLGGRIGVGSIAGIALAIYLGGIGSIFWMWITAFLSAPNSYAETVLGIIYKERDHGKVYKGGPSYYIRHGLGKPKLGAFYAILVLISYIGGFLGIQSNTITKSLSHLTTLSPIWIGIIICFFTAIIIFGGVQKIADATGKLVPAMTLVYLGVAFFVIVTNISLIPKILTEIITSAFQLKPFVAGFLTTFLIGIQRGIFSNEAGLGTGSIASSATASSDPSSQGYLQMVGIYITTFLICTATAIIILTSNYSELVLSDVNGIEITQYAFQFHLGNWGSILIFVSILLFSFSTILTGYYYGESSLKYFFRHTKKWVLILLKVFTLLVIFLGCVMSSTFLWALVDVFVALLAIINIYALFRLRKEVIFEHDCYNQRKCDRM